jgi:thioredoxin-like negative regulator of GroEL
MNAKLFISFRFYAITVLKVVFSIPTLLITKNGREVDRIVGLVPKKKIEAVLKKHLG